jgi:hypothetical protein
VTSRAPRIFDAQDLTIAGAVAVLAQLAFVALFSLPSPKLVQADISNENAQPIAVAITPVLKLGSKEPSPWQRRRPPPAVAKTKAPVPSTRAEKTPDAARTARPETSAAPRVVDAGRPEPMVAPGPDAASAASPAASTEGSEQGSVNGTETDPLKARAADAYRETLNLWFASRFHIRGKIPFDTLKRLHALAVVTVTPERTVGGFSITAPSGDSTFDAEVTATLAQIQSSGVELPAPPPMYSDILRSTLPVGFKCSIQRQCE